MTDVVLHIGLHKTATRFLQRAVFASLDPARFLVNPEPLTGSLKRALRHPGSVNHGTVRDAAERARAQAGERTLVVSDPTISGDMYSQHEDWADNLALVHELFPEALVIYFVRRPSDWLQSAYRQALVKGPGMPIEFFLNYRNGEFRQRPARRIGGARNVEALGLRFLDIYGGYARAYGAERVYLFRQEDLRRQPDAVYRRLAEVLGLQRLPDMPERVSGNRAFSALAIRLFFPGVTRSPSPDKPNDPRSAGLRRARGRLRQFRTMLIRHGFDRLFYRDWDLLEARSMRRQLDEHYENQERALTAIANTILEQGPGENALARADEAAHGRSKSR